MIAHIIVRRRSLCALAFVVAACHPAPAPAPAPAELVVLLPDPEDGKIGAATVSASGASVQLRGAGEATHIARGATPAAPSVLPDSVLRSMMADAVAARPLAPRSFILYFESGTNALTPESNALVAEIVAAIKLHPAPDLTVIGHTDRTADAQSNYQLGMSRATQVRDLLAARGVDASIVTVASHGESDPLVPTEDGVAHPLNRRVAVTVR